MFSLKSSSDWINPADTTHKFIPSLHQRLPLLGRFSRLLFTNSNNISSMEISGSEHGCTVPYKTTVGTSPYIYIYIYVYIYMGIPPYIALKIYAFHMVGTSMKSPLIPHFIHKIPSFVSAYFVLQYLDDITKSTKWCPCSLAKLVRISPITRVCGGYI